VSGKYAYVASYDDDGVEILDISDPANPTHVGAITDDGTTALNGAQYIYVSGKYAYITSITDNGVEILDISDPTNPTHVGAITDNGTTALDDPRGIYVSGKYAYVASSTDHGVEILDISDPANPTHVGAIFDDGTTELYGAYSIYVSGKYAYVTAYADAGVEILDISDPTNPTHIGAITDNGTTRLNGAFGIYISGKYAYVASGYDNGVEILDISGIDAPSASIGNIATSTLNVSENAQVGNDLYVSNGMIVGSGGIYSQGGISVNGIVNLNGNYLSGDGDEEGIYIDNVGKVGIGTSAPLDKLDVQGDMTLSIKTGIGFDRKINFDYDLSGFNAGYEDRTSYIQVLMNGTTAGPGSGTTAAQRMDFHISDNTTTGTTNVMSLVGNGNVGIGTNTPAATLDIVSTGDGANVLQLSTERAWAFQQEGTGSGSNLRLRNVNGLNKQFLIDTDGSTRFRSQDGSSTTMIIDQNNGRIGIGTTTLTQAKVVINGSVSSSLSYGWLNSSGNTGAAGSPSTNPYSLYANERIAASEFNAHSDMRIKNIRGTSNASEDLSTLMQIEVTDYTLRDTIAKGKTPQKKVIAQQVAQVYPQAVSTNLTEVIPDIYQRAEVKDGWIMLATDLETGDRVKIITESGSDIYEISAVENDRFQIEALNIEGETIFVYGREVDDFHTVDYEALSMLNVSATQEQ
ncbi:MAG: hypothetical protein KDD63_20870, partial [Bacteroidetes bacterium]|nr:hypothetical protein [Bacteroidota bacterium]